MRTALSFLAAALLTATSVHAATPRRFAVATVHMEQNATDGDYEIVIEAMGGEGGLSKLTVATPDGRTVVDCAAPDSSTLGVRQFRLESPEPGDLAKLRAAYPEGEYAFGGSDAGGVTFQSRVTLKHALPAAAVVTSPAAESRVAAGGLEIAWKPVAGLAAIQLTLEREGSDATLEARLPGAAHRFTVAPGFLAPGGEYKLAIGTVGPNGNITFVETTFETAAAK